MMDHAFLFNQSIRAAQSKNKYLGIMGVARSANLTFGTKNHMQVKNVEVI